MAKKNNKRESLIKKINFQTIEVISKYKTYTLFISPYPVTEIFGNDKRGLVISYYGIAKDGSSTKEYYIDDKIFVSDNKTAIKIMIEVLKSDLPFEQENPDKVENIKRLKIKVANHILNCEEKQSEFKILIIDKKREIKKYLEEIELLDEEIQAVKDQYEEGTTEEWY